MKESIAKSIWGSSKLPWLPLRDRKVARSELSLRNQERGAGMGGVVGELLVVKSQVAAGWEKEALS